MENALLRFIYTETIKRLSSNTDKSNCKSNMQQNIKSDTLGKQCLVQQQLEAAQSVPRMVHCCWLCLLSQS